MAPLMVFPASACGSLCRQVSAKNASGSRAAMSMALSSAISPAIRPGKYGAGYPLYDFRAQCQRQSCRHTGPNPQRGSEFLKQGVSHAFMKQPQRVDLGRSQKAAARRVGLQDTGGRLHLGPTVEVAHCRLIPGSSAAPRLRSDVGTIAKASFAACCSICRCSRAAWSISWCRRRRYSGSRASIAARVRASRSSVSG